ncbi:MAG: bifunctional folylpolyglutamate synthase/dihydrofolate synthase, partial [Sphingopyxis sp.]
MADHAHSDDPAVQAQLDRLAALSPGRDVLGLERIGALMQRLGNPHLRLPPIFHVAGTNGKGSTCAVLRAALETDGKIVHAYTSPHLVRFNERIRLSSRLISDEALAHYLNQVLNHAEGLSASFFEVTTAAAFLAFAEHPADACIIEVGLGGRLDATNILPLCAASGIAQLGVDHEGFLGSDPAGIAREKAGIARPMRPLVTMDYPIDSRAAVADVAEQTGATLLREGRDWSFAPVDGQLRVLFGARQVDARLPALPGAHQFANSALAIAMLMAQDHVTLSTQALVEAPAGARWPARLQSMAPGPLTAPIADRIVTLDGGHNVDCAMA